MFRRERPQKGRYRQFFQIGAEAIGSESPFIDAEVIEMVVEMLTRAGLSGFTLLINSVGDAALPPAVCGETARSAAAGGGAACAAIASAAPKPIRCACSIAKFRKISRSSINCRRFSIICVGYASRILTRCRRYLTIAGFAFEVRPRLVRGLDYYMRTTFEVTHGNLGAQNSVLGGGRYDGLAESLGSTVHSPGIGFSIGEDRLVMTVDQAADDRRSTSLWRRWAMPPCCTRAVWRANCGALAFRLKWRRTRN